MTSTKQPNPTTPRYRRVYLPRAIGSTQAGEVLRLPSGATFLVPKPPLAGWRRCVFRDGDLQLVRRVRGNGKRLRALQRRLRRELRAAAAERPVREAA